MAGVRTSLRSKQLLLTSDGEVIGPRGRVLKPSPRTGGYLKVTYRHDNGQRSCTGVHVLVCEAFHGPRPEGLVVRHRNGDKTDNRPANLCWGTPGENYEDRDAHGTTARGERQGLAKLTEDKVLQIRRLLREGLPQMRIAEQFGVSEPTIGAIAHRRTWAHVPNEDPEWVYRGRHGSTMIGEGNSNAKLSESQVKEIRSKLDAGVSQRKIAAQFGVSQGLVSKIRRGTTWAHIP